MGEKGSSLIAPVFILLIAFALRIYRLGDQNVWWDEGLAMWAVRKSFPGVTLWTASDVHPPLYFWSLWSWTRMVGESEFAARYLSLIWGMLIVALVYPLARRLSPSTSSETRTRVSTSRWVALVALFLTATARFPIWWSQELRMYILATLTSLLSFYAFVRALQEGERWAWLAYVSISVAALYTIYLTGLALLAEGLFVLLTLRRRMAEQRRFLVRWIGSQFLILALFAPWFIFSAGRMRTWSVSQPFDAKVFLELYAVALSLGISTEVANYLLPALVIVALALMGAVFLWRQKDVGRWRGWEASLYLSLPILLLPLAVYLLTLNRGLFYSPRVEARYLVLFAPSFYILLAAGLVGLWRWMRWGGVLATLLVAVIFAWSLPGYYGGRYMRDDYQTALRALAAYAQPDDGVFLVSGNRYPLFLYQYRRLVGDESDGPAVYLLPQDATIFTTDNVEKELSPLIAAHSRLWLASFERELSDPDNLVERWLDGHYRRALEVPVGHNHLTLYTEDGLPPEVPPSNLSPQYPLDVWLSAGGVRLLGYDLPTTEFRPGDAAHLGLYFQLAASRPATEMTVGWVDDQGRVVESRGVILGGLEEEERERIVRRGLDFPVYPRTPAGEYRFLVVAGEESVEVGRMQVTTTGPLLPVSAVPHPMEATLGGNIRFLGYDISGEEPIAPGSTLTLDLYWQAERKVQGSYTVFVHFVGDAYNPATGGPLWGQDDSLPVEGGYPTTQWLVGVPVRDRHRLVVDPQAPPGQYRIEVGMYQLPDVERLVVETADGTQDTHIPLGQVEIGLHQ
ncbi:MAG: glycosyltransferase family 39 protein [Chloroflexota bacterium]|nr:glycosyltransferase family 39 protein [Chloroflexota bacterium]